MLFLFLVLKYVPRPQDPTNPFLLETSNIYVSEQRGLGWGDDVHQTVENNI